MIVKWVLYFANEIICLQSVVIGETDDIFAGNRMYLCGHDETVCFCEA